MERALTGDAIDLEFAIQCKARRRRKWRSRVNHSATFRELKPMRENPSKTDGQNGARGSDREEPLKRCD
eukprot:1558631-Prymnesium_polylepis.1